MTNPKYLKFVNKIGVRIVIKSIFYVTSVSFVLVTSALIFKGRHAIKAKVDLLIAQQPKVAFVQTSQPFAMMHSIRSVKPAVERCQNTPSIAEVGGEVMANHSREIENFVAAHTHITHITQINRRSQTLSMSQNDRVAQVATPVVTTEGTGFQSFEKQKWRGFTFDYDYKFDLRSSQEKQLVKPSETYSYAFTSRYKIQRGDGTVDAFLPIKQLGRNTTLDFLAGKIEYEITTLLSNASSESSNFSEPEPGSESALISGSGFSSLSEAETASEGSRINFVQTGEEYAREIQLEPKEQDELVEKIVLGLGEMIVNEHNTSLLEKLVNSSKFEKAAELVHQEVAEEINQCLNAGPFTQQNVERVF